MVLLFVWSRSQEKSNSIAKKKCIYPTVSSITIVFERIVYDYQQQTLFEFFRLLLLLN